MIGVNISSEPKKRVRKTFWTPSMMSRVQCEPLIHQRAVTTLNIYLSSDSKLTSSLWTRLLICLFASEMLVLGTQTLLGGSLGQRQYQH